MIIRDKEAKIITNEKTLELLREKLEKIGFKQGDFIQVNVTQE